MKINITKREYRALFKLFMVTTWMGLDEAHLKEDPPVIEGLDALQDRMLSLAKDFGCEDWVQPYKNGFDPTVDWEEWGIAALRDRDDEQFWQDLALRLAQRDVIETMGEDTYEALEPIDRGTKVGEREELYLLEFSEHGIDRLHINSK